MESVTEAEDIKHSELKTIATNHLLNQTVHNNIIAKLRKTEKICLNYPSLSSISSSLPKYISLFVFYTVITISYFFPPVPGISILKFSRLTSIVTVFTPPQLLTISESIQHIQPSGMPSYLISNYYKYCSH